MFFNGTNHKKFFTEECRLHGKNGRNPSSFLAALYLLTSNKKLWSRTYSSVKQQSIRFDKMDIRGVSANEYTLLKTAQDLYLGTSHIGICELCDPYIIPDQVLRLITTAVSIKRFGKEEWI